MTSQADEVVTVVARIDAYGRVDMRVDGTPSNANLGNVEEARSHVGQQAAELAARLGRDVLLDTSDPEGSWLFVARPDGSVVETTSAPAPAPSPRGRAESCS